jgi:hypothetical protein
MGGNRNKAAVAAGAATAANTSDGQMRPVAIWRLANRVGSDAGCDYTGGILKLWRFTMSITFDLPAAVEQQLRRDVTNLDVLAKEAALVELYRQGTISHYQLGLSLGMTRFETDDLLKRHHVTEDLITAEELGEQIATLRRLIGQ